MTSVPKALLVHQIGGRVRLRLLLDKQDAEHLMHAHRLLKEHEAVHDVKANPLTSSLLIRHADDFSAIQQYAEEGGLFTIEVPITDVEFRGLSPSEKLSAILQRRVRRAEHQVNNVTGGGADLSMLGFAAFLGLAWYQFVRGNFLPAGTTLFTQALECLPRTPQHENIHHESMSGDLKSIGH